ncbi:response regulator [Cohnella zeiphila]|uniref:Response regulator n=1 Tax=Cohnella zeiphila TaxID=2761120 RepID=A0A7X0VYC7_9BACL|nr:response regulator [Cohnella zeiphila]MBB6734347.1 response regulator [Cohnella zeiphila]
MFKVMIADDESWIRKGLRAMIDWDRLGLAWDGEATDGLEALQMAESRKPDILITDIRMPGLDGLQLAETLTGGSPHLKVLIVSGYGEFEYARKALQLDAVSYILKPIDPEELNRTLERAVGKLETERKERLMTTRLPDLLEKQAADLCRGEKVRPELAEAFLETLRLQGADARCLACLLLHYDDERYDSAGMAALVAEAASSLPSSRRRLIVWERGQRRIGAVVLADDDTGLRTFARSLLWTLRKNNVCGVWATMGEAFAAADAGRLGVSCRQALELAERNALHRSEEFMAYGPETEEKPPFQYPLHLQRRWNESLRLNDVAGSEAVLADIVAYYATAEGASLTHARSFFLSIASDAAKHVLDQSAEDRRLAEAGFAFCRNIDTFDDLERMAGRLRQFVRDAADQSAGEARTDVRKNILAAAEYIRENYAEDIGLNSVSARFYVTPSYFSSTFKEVIGENFVDFLTRVRIGKAKEYLRGSAVKVGEIGKLVGYSDSRYFSKLFKKHVGKMPTEYREDCLREAGNR